MRLEGRVALITGAGSGIGRALSIELSRRGVRPLLLGRRRGALEETRSLLAEPARAVVLPLDLADPRARAGIAELVERAAGRLDLLVNNAGSVLAGPLSGQREQAWRDLLEVNLLAPMAVTQALLPLLKSAGQGRVVNVGSMFGDIAFPLFAAYSASKFGLRGWSEALRRELAGTGVGVTYCAPRGTRTPAADGFERYVKTFSMRLDPSDRVARRIADGIAGGARDVYPGSAERLFLLVQTLLPGVVDRGLRRATALALADASSAPAGAIPPDAGT